MNDIVADFYARPDLEDGFGSLAGDRNNPHRGLDFPHALGTPVPAYSPGVVTISEWHPGLGNIIEVKGDNGRYVGGRHLRSAGRKRAQVGDRVEFGTIIGEVSDTGSLANGYHYCTTNSSKPGGVYGLEGVVDPWPYIVRAVNGDDGVPHIGGPLPRTSTEEDGDPGPIFWARFQLWAAQHGYAGPIDGVPGPNTWIAAQRALGAFGYNGPADGVPGPNTYAALQRLAAQHGYTGPIDGGPGPNTWRGVARFLNTL